MAEDKWDFIVKKGKVIKDFGKKRRKLLGLYKVKTKLGTVKVRGFDLGETLSDAMQTEDEVKAKLIE
jgi:hypothetical protein